MSDPTPSEVVAVPVVQKMRVVKLIGFSLRDRELLRLFLRRPPRAGVSLTVTEDGSDEPVDLLIVNVAAPESREALRDWRGARPAIGIVERFETDAAYYQIAQDGQMLFVQQPVHQLMAFCTGHFLMAGKRLNQRVLIQQVLHLLQVFLHVFGVVRFLVVGHCPLPGRLRVL